LARASALRSTMFGLRRRHSQSIAIVVVRRWCAWERHSDALIDVELPQVRWTPSLGVLTESEVQDENATKVYTRVQD
jgi:hypothetical protein